MTPEQKSAFIVAQTAMMNIEVEIMRAENVERESHNLCQANGPEQWEAFRQRWEPVLGYNSLISFFNE